MGWTLRTAAIKGRKEDINAFLNSDCRFDVKDVEDLGRGIALYHVNLGDKHFDCDFQDIPWSAHTNIKFIALAHKEGANSDKVLFKHFGSNQILKGIAFTSDWFSAFSQELTGYHAPFMDQDFSIQLDEYFNGETYEIRNAMRFEQEWEDDSMFDQI